MFPYSTPNTEEPIIVAKEIVRLIGVTLGNLMHRIFSGTVHKTDWNDEDRESVKGTTVFLLGGSICTMGYTRVLLPLIAQRRLSKINSTSQIKSGSLLHKWSRLMQEHSVLITWRFLKS